LPAIAPAVGTVIRTDLSVHPGAVVVKTAAHILERIGFDHQSNAVNQVWQQGNARVHDVRQAGFQVHRLAKSCEDTVVQSALPGRRLVRDICASMSW